MEPGRTPERNDREPPLDLSSQSIHPGLRPQASGAQLMIGGDIGQETVNSLLVHALYDRASEIIIEFGSPVIKVYHTKGDQTYQAGCHLPSHFAAEISRRLELMFGLLVPEKLSLRKRLAAGLHLRGPAGFEESGGFKDGETVLQHVLEGPVRYGRHVLSGTAVKLGLMRNKLDDETKSYKIILQYS